MVCSMQGLSCPDGVVDACRLGVPARCRAYGYLLLCAKLVVRARECISLRRVMFGYLRNAGLVVRHEYMHRFARFDASTTRCRRDRRWKSRTRCLGARCQDAR